MAEAPKLKDYFTEQLVRDIGARIATVHPDFDVDRFVEAAVGDGWEAAGLTERSRRIADALWATLDLGVEATLDVIVRCLPDELDDPEGVLNDGFWMWPFGDLIATYALECPDAALDACEALTKRFTAEFAVRPFLAGHPEALDRVERWATDDSEHVRRLASEGTRPRLPWATRLDLPLERVLPVLATLRRDESPYVRRSVANHLNDLAKDHDEIVDVLAQWHAEGVDETTWIVRHALRNHLKQGDPRALRLFGYEPALIDVAGLEVAPRSVAIGEQVEVGFDLVEVAGRAQKLMVDLVVGYVKANGSLSPKVFKFKDFELAAGATLRCTKRLDMTPRSIRTLHPGTHTVTIRVNGADLADATFDLTR